MAGTTAIVTKKTRSTVIDILAAKYQLNSDTFVNTIKATVMRPDKTGRVATNEEVAAFLVVASKYDLDPFTNEIYAFPGKKGGIVPIVGIDGFVTIMNRQKDFNGYELTYDENEITMEGAKSCPAWAEVKIYHKDREHPTVVREYLDEVYVPKEAKGGYTGPWQTHTKRMLRHKALIQGIRVAFGITGIYDPDEADRILQAEAATTGDRPQIGAPGEIDGGPKKVLINEAQRTLLMTTLRKNGYKVGEDDEEKATDDIHPLLKEKYGIASVNEIEAEWLDGILENFKAKKKA